MKLNIKYFLKIILKNRNNFLKLKKSKILILLFNIRNFKYKKKIIYTFLLFQYLIFHKEKIILRKYQILIYLKLFNNIVEAPTGSGKTISFMPFLIYNLLNNKTVHYITSNIFLLKRDYKKFKYYFDYFLLKILFIKDVLKYQYILNIKNTLIIGTNRDFLFYFIKEPMLQINNFDLLFIDEIDQNLYDKSFTSYSVVKKNQYVNKNKLSFFQNLLYISKNLIFNKEFIFYNDKIFFLDLFYYKYSFLSELQIKYIEKILIIIKNNQMFNNYIYDCNNNSIKLINNMTSRINHNIKRGFFDNMILSLLHNIDDISFSESLYKLKLYIYINFYLNVRGCSATIDYLKYLFLELIGVPTYTVYLKKNFEEKNYIVNNHSKRNNLIASIIQKHIKNFPIIIVCENTLDVNITYNFINEYFRLNNFTINKLNNFNENKDQLYFKNICANTILITNKIIARGVDIILKTNQSKQELLDIDSLIIDRLRLSGIAMIINFNCINLRLRRQLKGRVGRNKTFGKVFHIKNTYFHSKDNSIIHTNLNELNLLNKLNNNSSIYRLTKEFNFNDLNFIDSKIIDDKYLHFIKTYYLILKNLISRKFYKKFLIIYLYLLKKLQKNNNDISINFSFVKKKIVYLLNRNMIKIDFLWNNLLYILDNDYNEYNTYFINFSFNSEFYKFNFINRQFLKLLLTLIY